MHLVTFEHKGQVRLGALVNKDDGKFILDINKAEPTLPAELIILLSSGASALESVVDVIRSANTTELIPEGDVNLLAPLPNPGKILCVGYNYLDHIGKGNTEIPQYPNIFCKTANTITGHRHPIIVPQYTQQVDYEAELAVIIGKKGYDIPESDAMSYIAGYSIFNDVSARDYQNRTSQWLLGKSFDTFGPLGPALVTPDEIPDPHDLDLKLSVNGVLKQHTNTRNMIFKIPFLVSYISQVMTLEPGDIISTGTPAKLPEAAQLKLFLKPGDQVEIVIEKLGVLVNMIELRENS